MDVADSRTVTHDVPGLLPPTPPVVLSTGTPFGGWLDVAHSLLSAGPDGSTLTASTLAAWCDEVLGDAETRAARGAVSWLDAAGCRPPAAPGETLWGSVDARLVWALPAIEAAWPQARWLVFIESPASAIAARLGSQPAALDVAALLESWCAGAEALLRLARQSPARCVLLDAQECRQHPAAAAARLGERLGLSFGRPAPLPATALSPVISTLAEGLLPSDHLARQRHAELQALCPPLGEPTQPRPGAAAVVQGVQQWLTAQTRLPQLSRELGDLRRELETRTQQADQMQEELEFFHAELQQRPAARGLGRELSVGRLSVRTERDRAPHRELSLALEEVRLLDGPAGDLDLRLVEHHGRPGLVLFGQAGRSLLSGWTESGNEHGRGYMLLVPRARSTHKAGRGLSATDWQLLLALTDHLIHAIPQLETLSQRLFWSLTAVRLRQQLDEVDWGLGLDGLSVSARPAEQGGGVRLSFDRLRLQPRTVNGLQLLLAPGRRLSLAGRDAQGLPPLPSWPMSGDTTPADTWELPLGGSPRVAQGRARWDGVSAADHAFIVSLLGALGPLLGRPEVAAALGAAGLGDAGQWLPALAGEARRSLPRASWRRRAAAVWRAWKAR